MFICVIKSYACYYLSCNETSKGATYFRLTIE